ncbi:MAG: nucleotide exchange factor GrpE, partial [Candidatus Colwellbacteria bacterium RIFCSPHIGHO2_02_FULL_45_17]
MLIYLMSDKDKDPKEEAGPKKDRKDVKDELKRAKTERDEYLDGWKRAKADLINYKRDELRRLEQVVQFANEDMISDIITVIDSFELAIASMEKDNPAVKGT